MLHGPIRRKWSLEAIVRLVDDRQARARWMEDLREAGHDLGDLDWLESARTLDPPPPEPDPDARWRAVQRALERAQELAGGSIRGSGERDP